MRPSAGITLPIFPSLGGNWQDNSILLFLQRLDAMAAPIHASTAAEHSEETGNTGGSDNLLKPAAWQHLSSGLGPLEEFDPCSEDAENLIQRGLNVIGSDFWLNPNQFEGLIQDMSKATMHLIYEGKGLTEQKLFDLKYRDYPVKLNVWGVSRVIAQIDPNRPVQIHRYLSDIVLEQEYQRPASRGGLLGYYPTQHAEINQFIAGHFPPNLAAKGSIQEEMDKSEVHKVIKAHADGKKKLNDFTYNERRHIAQIAEHAPHLFSQDPGNITRKQFFDAMCLAANNEQLPEKVQKARNHFEKSKEFEIALCTFPEFAAWILGFTSLPSSPPPGFMPI